MGLATPVLWCFHGLYYTTVLSMQCWVSSPPNVHIYYKGSISKEAEKSPWQQCGWHISHLHLFAALVGTECLSREASTKGPIFLNGPLWLCFLIGIGFSGISRLEPAKVMVWAESISAYAVQGKEFGSAPDAQSPAGDGAGQNVGKQGCCCSIG